MNGPSVRPLCDVEGDGMRGGREGGVVVDVQEEAWKIKRCANSGEEENQRSQHKKRSSSITWIMPTTGNGVLIV